MKKERLDVLLVEKGLVESRSLAQKLIMSGEVLVNGQVAAKSGQTYEDTVTISLKAKPPYVSRGGEKLLAALEAFKLTNLNGLVCVDVGASTGGFTDCLLQHGAVRVYAVDVGYGQLHEKLRKDDRVINMERTNARNIHTFPEKIDLVTIDASFISLKTLLPVIKTWANDNLLRVIALVKPQFEVGRDLAARGKGVIRDEHVRKEVVEDILAFARQQGFKPQGVQESPLTGPKGNREFLIDLLYQ
jgi:23S rRNA (cytidine1920-2'-O)/16S rRNA (cytidine1409-2'-O)-methyltransferase